MITILFLVFTFYQKNTIFKQYKFNENFFKKLSSNKSDLIEINNCNPILSNTNQNSVLINGIRYPFKVTLQKNMSINFECLNNSSTRKVILFYNNWWSDKNYATGTGYRTPFIKMGCPVTNCETTSDLNRLNESDYVITHMWNHVELPSFRPQKSRWIFLNYVWLSFFFFNLN